MKPLLKCFYEKNPKTHKTAVMKLSHKKMFFQGEIPVLTRKLQEKLQWKKVSSEFLKRSVNGPWQLNIFIHSVGKKTSSKITKLDDDRNLFKVKKSRTSWAQFQKSLRVQNYYFTNALQIIHNMVVHNILAFPGHLFMVIFIDTTVGYVDPSLWSLFGSFIPTVKTSWASIIMQPLQIKLKNHFSTQYVIQLNCGTHQQSRERSKVFSYKLMEGSGS